jgi:hypothetical protein
LEGGGNVEQLLQQARAPRGVRAAEPLRPVPEQLRALHLAAPVSS